MSQALTARQSVKLLRAERIYAGCALGFVLAAVVWTYSASIRDSNYRSDDYLFLSQVTRHGLITSLVIPWKDHFLPLYRLFMGGLYLVFGNAVPTRAGILGFHLLATCLIFQIVYSHARSIVLSGASSLTFGLSYPVSGCVLWCAGGFWGMSLCFILLMYICFEGFLGKHNARLSMQPPAMESFPQTFANDFEYQAGFRSWRLYYAGLVFFAIGLGVFTAALFGGIAVWLFLFIRLVHRKMLDCTIANVLKLILPFVFIVSAYVIARAFLNEKYFLAQDTLFQQASLAAPGLSPAEKLAVLRDAWPGLFLRAIQLMSPYFPQRYSWVLTLFAVLLMTGYLFRKQFPAAPVFWMGFALLTLIVPLAGRAFFIFKVFGSMQLVIQPWYYYYSVAGVSISFALALRPPPSLEERFNAAPVSMRAVAFSVVTALLVWLNYGNVDYIRAKARQEAQENLRFHEVVASYKEAMTSFLESSANSARNEFLFRDILAADVAEYPAGWSVMQHNIFDLYFPDVRNVHFVDEKKTGADLYIWTPKGVIH